MGAEKTVGMAFRVTPETKRLLVAAAEQEHRTLTNMFEVLVEEFCARTGIGGKTPAATRRMPIKRKKSA